MGAAAVTSSTVPEFESLQKEEKIDDPPSLAPVDPGRNCS